MQMKASEPLGLVPSWGGGKEKESPKAEHLFLPMGQMEPKEAALRREGRSYL